MTKFYKQAVKFVTGNAGWHQFRGGHMLQQVMEVHREKSELETNLLNTVTSFAFLSFHNMHKRIDPSQG